MGSLIRRRIDIIYNSFYKFNNNNVNSFSLIYIKEKNF